jgi:hypothetical protein
MLLSLLWVLSKVLDAISTSMFVARSGWQMEANPLMIVLYNNIGWVGYFVLTIIVALVIYALDKFSKQYPFLKFVLWIYVIVNIWNPLRNFWLIYN